MSDESHIRPIATGGVVIIERAVVLPDVGYYSGMRKLLAAAIELSDEASGTENDPDVRADIGMLGKSLRGLLRRIS